MTVLLAIVLSTFLISFISLVGVLTLALKKDSLDKILLELVSISAGTLMGGAFLHLLPETIMRSTDIRIFLYLLSGFTLFFLIEKVLHWRHCHIRTSKEHPHTFAYMNLIGDGIHNFIDGLIIAASFVTSIPLGITTSVAIAFHEIPQEIGDFGVLVYGKFSVRKALIFNFLSAITAIVGGIVGFFLSSHIQEFTVFLLPLAAGGFIYIASSDLIPEFKKQDGLKKSLTTFSIFLIGILIMWVARGIFL